MAITGPALRAMVGTTGVTVPRLTKKERSVLGRLPELPTMRLSTLMRRCAKHGYTVGLTFTPQKGIR